MPDPIFLHMPLVQPEGDKKHTSTAGIHLRKVKALLYPAPIAWLRLQELYRRSYGDNQNYRFTFIGTHSPRYARLKYRNAVHSALAQLAVASSSSAHAFTRSLLQYTTQLASTEGLLALLVSALLSEHSAGRLSAEEWLAFQRLPLPKLRSEQETVLIYAREKNTLNSVPAASLVASLQQMQTDLEKEFGVLMGERPNPVTRLQQAMGVLMGELPNPTARDEAHMGVLMGERTHGMLRHEEHMGVLMGERPNPSAIKRPMARSSADFVATTVLASVSSEIWETGQDVFNAVGQTAGEVLQGSIQTAGDWMGQVGAIVNDFSVMAGSVFSGDLGDTNIDLDGLGNESLFEGGGLITDGTGQELTLDREAFDTNPGGPVEGNNENQTIHSQTGIDDSGDSTWTPNNEPEPTLQESGAVPADNQNGNNGGGNETGGNSGGDTGGGEDPGGDGNIQGGDQGWADPETGRDGSATTPYGGRFTSSKLIPVGTGLLFSAAQTGASSVPLPRLPSRSEEGDCKAGFLASARITRKGQTRSAATAAPANLINKIRDQAGPVINPAQNDTRPASTETVDHQPGINKLKQEGLLGKNRGFFKKK